MSAGITTYIQAPSTTCTSLSSEKSPLDTRRVATVILGGGQGTRLFPLTKGSCKPFLLYGGKYRLIDVPISNALNSGCNQIFILTQFLSNVLNRHISSTYQFSSFSQGFIRLLSAEERPEKKVWFQGTADAVRQSLDHLKESEADYFLILSGDQLYHMDFNKMLKRAEETDADLIISCLSTDEESAKRMGVAKINGSGFLTAFHEKPQLQEDLLRMRLTPKDPDYLASMGIYMFKRKALFDLLTEDTREDFGKHLIPTQVKKGNVAAYIHEGYWEDIGTVASFYEANIALTTSTPPFNCFDEKWRIFTNTTSLPGARVYNSKINCSILSEGSIIDTAEVNQSIIGPRTIIGKGSSIHSSYLLGNDIHYTEQKFYIGTNCVINRAIIDKQVTIGNNVQLVNKNKLFHYDGEIVYIRDGIIVVPSGTTIPDGFSI